MSNITDSSLYSNASLASESLQALEAQLAIELQPRGVVEQALVRQIAMSTALLELSSDWEQSIAHEFRQSLINPWQLKAQTSNDELMEMYQRLLDSNALTKATAYTQKHFRRMTKSLETLARLKQRKQPESVPKNMPKEQECVDRLRFRFDSPDWACPVCHHPKGDWLSQRQVWECRQCHRQTGLRVGTPCENSPLPLRKWAFCYELLRWDPGISTRTLAIQLDISRLETVRRLRKVLLPLLENPEALGGLVT